MQTMRKYLRNKRMKRSRKNLKIFLSQAKYDVHKNKESQSVTQGKKKTCVYRYTRGSAD